MAGERHGSELKIDSLHPVVLQIIFHKDAGSKDHSSAELKLKACRDKHSCRSIKARSSPCGEGDAVVKSCCEQPLPS